MVLKPGIAKRITAGPTFPTLPLPGRSWSQAEKEEFTLKDVDLCENTTSRRIESLLNCFLCYIYTLIGRQNRKRVSDHQKMRVMSQCLYSYKWSCCKVNQGIRPVLTISTLADMGLPCAQHRQGDTIIGSGTSSQKKPLGTISQTSSPCPISPEPPHQLMPLSQAHRPHWETLRSSDRMVYHLGALKALPVFFSRTHSQIILDSVLEQVIYLDIKLFSLYSIFGV